MTEECQQITWPPSANIGTVRPSRALRRTECHAKHKAENTAILVLGLNRDIVFRARPKRRIPHPSLGGCRAFRVARRVKFTD